MTRKEILEKATECVTGKREADHGSAEDNFTLIARLWSDYCGYGFSPTDVAMMMALLKIARIKCGGGGSGDSFVDLAGYAACGGEIAGRQMHKVADKPERKSPVKGMSWEEYRKYMRDALNSGDVPGSGMPEEIFTEEDMAQLIAGVRE